MNKFICQYCLERFNTSSFLLKHQRTSKICLNYKDVFFICKKCNITIIGIKNLDNHIRDDKCDDNISIISDNNYIIEDTSDTEITFDITSNITLQKQIIKLETELKTEKIKNDVLTQLIEKNIHIPLKIDTYVTIPTINELSPTHSNKSNDWDKGWDECYEYCEDDNEDENEKPKNLFKNYRVFSKTYIELGQELTQEELEIRIKNINMNIYNSKQCFGDLESSKKIFKKEIDVFKNANRLSLKSFDTFNIIRKKLFGSLSISEYISLVQKHINIIKHHLEIRNVTEKKIISIIKSSLSSIEIRLLFYENYYTVELDKNEYTHLKTCMDIFAVSYSYFTPFVLNEFMNQFYNYGSVIVPIKTCIEYYLFNKYNFNNIIYVPIKHSTQEDPYSFYILEKVVKDKRFWKMDCRMLNTAYSIMDNLKIYLINLFRNIYLHIFNDNDYRQDYIEKSRTNDLTQLLQNILVLSDPGGFIDLIRNIVIQKATYTPTENDKFNLYADDIVLKKKFSKTKDYKDIIINSIKTIFDNITDEQAYDLYMYKN